MQTAVELAQTLSVSEACKVVDVTRSNFYRSQQPENTSIAALRAPHPNAL